MLAVWRAAQKSRGPPFGASGTTGDGASPQVVAKKGMKSTKYRRSWQIVESTEDIQNHCLQLTKSLKPTANHNHRDSAIPVTV